MPAGVINYQDALKVLVSVKGHPFERDPFGDMFEAMEGVSATFVDQPASSELLNPEAMSEFDVLCLYDMPGIDFMHADAPGYVSPPQRMVEGINRLLDSGKGIVALHHSIAGWPAWPEYADYLGGRFLYRPDTLRGQSCPDSGYRHDVTHTVSRILGTDEIFEPIFDGLPSSFQLTDELYLSQVFERDVIPLLRSDYEFSASNFYSAKQAVMGNMYSREGWRHGNASNVVAWVKRARNSPLVYIQFGDGPETYKDPNFRRLLANALKWVSGEPALSWAAQSG